MSAIDPLLLVKGSELRQVMKEVVREALAEQVRAPAGAVGASKAHQVIGVSRGQFYNFRKKEPSLNELSFKMGDSDRDYWLVDDLKEWMKKQQQRKLG
jgi:hypothetical protein